MEMEGLVKGIGSFAASRGGAGAGKGYKITKSVADMGIRGVLCA